MLVRLIYVSFTSNLMDEVDLEKILQKSKFNNARKKLTGILVYSDCYFLQYLEGERQEVNLTYQTIINDPRHANCVLIDYAQVSSRLFPAWSMEQVRFYGADNEVILKYSESGVFCPYEYTGDQAYQFVCDITQRIAEESNRTQAHSKSVLFCFKR